jgi:hypothetical protein
MWVKKGDVVNGKKVEKGYVAQYGKPEKRVTNRVKLEVDTPKRGKAGDVVRLKQGSYVKKKAAAPSSNKGGSGGSGGGAGGGGSDSGTKSNYKTASRMGKPGQYQAGAGTTSRRPASSGTVSSAIAQGRKMGPSGTSYKPKPKTAVQKAVSKSSGYVRGATPGLASLSPEQRKRVIDKNYGGNVKTFLAKQRAEDTKNQGRNAMIIAGLAAAPFLAAGGAKLGGAALAARLGTAAMQQGAKQGLQSGARYAAGQGAARGSMAATKAAAKPVAKAVAKRPKSATKTPAWTKYGKDIKITRNARDRAQQARLDKVLADSKKAASAKKATAKKATPTKRTPAKRTPKKK